MSTGRGTTHDTNAGRREHGARSRQKGMLSPNRGYITAKTTNPNQERQRRTNKSTYISKTKTEDTVSEQDGAFKKEHDTETPSPSGPEKPDLGFPLSSKRGSAESLDSASNKETTSTDAAAASFGKPSKDFSLA